MSRAPRSAFVLALLLPLASAPAATPMTARAMLTGADNAGAGTATLSETEAGLKLTVIAKGLPPGVHGVHIHATGKCDGPDFKTAGAHWNPTGKMHGKDAAMGMHMGDLPNLTISADGTGRLETIVAGASLANGGTPLLEADGAAVVVHAAADDYKTDPSGNSGARIACGVIKPS